MAVIALISGPFTTPLLRSAKPTLGYKQTQQTTEALSQALE
jgi:hypothetical protein